MVKVKICGITRQADAVLASELGASAVGFVFWEQSPRAIDPAQAKAIVALLPPDVAAVGVFVDAPKDWVRDVVDRVNLSAVQLHGQETVEYCQNMPCRVIRAVPFRGPADIDAATQMPAEITVLLDAYDPVSKGGTGQAIDWVAASAAASQRRIFLAGGLGPDNVVEAIKKVRPYAIDASSRLETAPGLKDASKVRAFFKAVETEAFRS